LTAPADVDQDIECLWFPRSRSRGPAMKASNQASRSNRLLLSTALPPAFVFAACALSILGSSTANHTSPPHSNLASSSSQRFPLEISPDPIDLDVIRQGESARATLRLPEADPWLPKRAQGWVCRSEFHTKSGNP
jgi:hypothetical protein